MVTQGDTDVITALKGAVCCSCNSIRVLVMGILFGALVVWLSTAAGLYLAKQLPTGTMADTSVATPVVSFPAPVIDTAALAEVCLTAHHPKASKTK
ncbi:MAG: hypothetical protein BWK73_20105 [Thiothrix lacustris]|uniref:Uncharacterized protein n=1 Tax=Thiothrix lacustris TaxID=525917 RepID=A0A1Y1QPI4_9GAMM|nr:MAG: hypothetical protein BWK73_20105 [Thiothrix lacustris]